MGLLVESIQATRAIEVGTFTGYSSVAIAQVGAAVCPAKNTYNALHVLNRMLYPPAHWNCTEGVGPSSTL